MPNQEQAKSAEQILSEASFSLHGDSYAFIWNVMQQYATQEIKADRGKLVAGLTAKRDSMYDRNEYQGGIISGIDTSTSFIEDAPIELK